MKKIIMVVFLVAMAVGLYAERENLLYGQSGVTTLWYAVNASQKQANYMLFTAVRDSFYYKGVSFVVKDETPNDSMGYEFRYYLSGATLYLELLTKLVMVNGEVVERTPVLMEGALYEVSMRYDEDNDLMLTIGNIGKFWIKKDN